MCILGSVVRSMLGNCCAHYGSALPGELFERSYHEGEMYVAQCVNMPAKV